MKRFCGLLGFIFFSTQVYSAQPLRVDITVETDIYFYALDIMAEKAPIDVIDFHGKNSQRDVIEFILVQKAIALGGMDLQFNISHGNYDARNPKLLAKGLLLVAFDTIWLSEAKKIEDFVYISDPIIKKGQFWAGIYTSPNNVKALAIKNLNDFKTLSVVSSRAWRTDWSTLSAINPHKLVNEGDWISMAKMVSNQWIDAMLIPFPKKQPFMYQGHDYKVVAVDGIKIQLDDSRHFLVSRKHPLGLETFIALQKGIKLLRAQGVIEKAYKQSGFFNETTTDWQVLNP